MPSDSPNPEMILESEQEEIDRPISTLFREYGKDHRLLVSAAIFGSVVSPLVGLVPTYMLQVAIDAVFLQETPFELPLVPPSMIPAGRFDQLLVTAGVIVSAVALGSGLNWFSRRAWGRFAQEVQHQLRIDVYERVQQLGMSFFNDQQTGQIISILNSDVSETNQLLRQFLGMLVRTGVQFVGVVGIMLYLHWQLGLIAMLVVPVMALMSKWFVNRIDAKFKQVRQDIGALNSQIESNINGIRVIKSYTAEQEELERVREASRSVYQRTWAVIRTRAKFFPAMSLVNWLSFSGILILGGVWILRGPPMFFTQELSVGTLVAFLLYNQRLARPLTQIGRAVDTYYDARASVLRILALKNYDIAVTEHEETVDPDSFAGAVTFDDVTFGYADSPEPVLEDVSLDIEPESFVGIVGPTGSGKTTLTKLLLRFYDPDTGTVSIDGTDVRDLDLRTLRSRIGLVAQEPYLFSGTVSENIGYGTQATPEDIRAAARVANAHEFITDLPDGYETRVGQRGVKLSGGQRQRIALARAIVTEPDILVMDEATSHVDNETEALIQQSLSNIVAERTTFAVAHRLSTVRHADTILVLDDGEIVERGTHDELVASDGLYAALWRVQIGEYAAVSDDRRETLP